MTIEYHRFYNVKAIATETVIQSYSTICVKRRPSEPNVLQEPLLKWVLLGFEILWEVGMLLLVNLMLCSKVYILQKYILSWVTFIIKRWNMLTQVFPQVFSRYQPVVHVGKSQQPWAGVCLGPIVSVRKVWKKKSLIFYMKFWKSFW